MTTVIKPAGEADMVHIYRAITLRRRELQPSDNIAVIHSRIKYYTSCDIHVQSTAEADRNVIRFAAIVVIKRSIGEEMKVCTKCHGSPSDSYFSLDLDPSLPLF